MISPSFLSAGRYWLAAIFTIAVALPVIPLCGATPEAERASFQFADPNLVADLVAAEPDVVSPVALTWDAAGRLYVAEMRDYPNAPSGGTIRLLEDRDGDGRCEVSRNFADGLHFPNGVLPWNGGLLVTAAPDIWFLKDTDGDGRADERRVVFTGFGTGNQQLRVNGLFWGVDGWIYGANGRSDGEVTRPGSTNRWSLRGRDFRFKPDTGEFETLAGRCQFGHARDDWGNRFLSWNTIPIRHEVFPDRHLAHQSKLAAVDVVADCLPEGDSGQIFPLTPPPLVFNNESGAHFNALSGLHVFRGDALGPAYRGNAFVGESLRNLVHRRALVPDGTTFRAERPESGKEFLAGTDPWFHPVNFATGPDGSLYIADFYRQFVEHPDWVAKDTRDRVNWSVGGEHGRIWRVHRRDQKPARSELSPALDTTATARLARELDSPNAWRRDTAARLLLERHDTAAASGVAKVSRRGSNPEGRLLALHVAAALAPAETRPTARALKDKDPHVRAQAARLATGRAELQTAVVALAADPDLRVRLETALALSAVAEDGVREPALERIAGSSPDRWLRLAAASSSTRPESTAFALPSSKPAVSRPAPVPRGADPDRQRVIAQYEPALKLVGDRARGAATLNRLCLSCHYVQGHGQRVGPDLSGVATRPLETLLIDVLDPSRQVAPDYAAVEVTTTGGETITGLIASETSTRLTIRHAGSPDESVARNQVKEIRATGRSLMPDGLEQGLTAQDIADLLSFVRAPDATLLTLPK